uniref:lycopene beta-cyclase n=1 Tax=Gloiopeltis furcata TaxID=42017 RepID=A0A2H4YKH0_9FLOR|nr:lycopene epsilon-cyclase [Gloiopeltis furcata]
MYPPSLFVAPLPLAPLAPLVPLASRTPSLQQRPRFPLHPRASLPAAFDAANTVSPLSPRVTQVPHVPSPAAARATHATAPEPPPRLHDVAVIGAGPAGLSLAAALARHAVSVVVLDPALHAPWPNHYGVWRDEFAQVGLEDCATAVYPTTAVYAGPEKITLDRAYLRVDRVMLKERLMSRCVDGGVRLCCAAVSAVEHVSEAESEVYFTAVGGEGEGEETGVVRARTVVDCTGHALRFTKAEGAGGKFRAPWAQAAYGIEAEVESYPYKGDEMLLMDFRDAHMQEEEGWRRASNERPTFLYVFPSGETRAFFEETSVIAPTAVPFEELKERLYRRLRHDGVRVKRVIEEERSLIPMGGSLPSRAQRVVGFGGAACLVHPATGYMVARTVAMADVVARTIAHGLSDSGGLSGKTRAMAVSEAVWTVTWSLELRRQRDFLAFGAELLGVLDMDESRRFFEAFFALPDELWGRFLGFGLDSPGVRTYFALYFFGIASWPIRWGLLRGIVEIGRWGLIRSVLPLWMSARDES